MILVKVGRDFKKLFKDDDIDIPELVEPVIKDSREFEPEEQLSDDEWFYINLRENKEIVENYGNKFSSTASLNPVVNKDFAKISIIFKEIQESKIVFQKVTNSKRLENKRLIKVNGGGEAKAELIESGIEIKKAVDAYFDGDCKLYFKNFSTIKNLFKGIEEFYRIASENEMNDFKEMSIVSCGQDLNDFGSRNMKMLAIILDDEEINMEDPKFKQKLLEEYKEYKEQLDFQVNNGQFLINTKAQLNNFLKLVLGRLYKNPMTGRKMEASTAKKLN